METDEVRRYGNDFSSIFSLLAIETAYKLINLLLLLIDVNIY